MPTRQRDVRDHLLVSTKQANTPRKNGGWREGAGDAEARKPHNLPAFQSMTPTEGDAPDNPPTTLYIMPTRPCRHLRARSEAAPGHNRRGRKGHIRRTRPRMLTNRERSPVLDGDSIAVTATLPVYRRALKTVSNEVRSALCLSARLFPEKQPEDPRRGEESKSSTTSHAPENAKAKIRLIL